MAHIVVKITARDDGEAVRKDEQVWCLVHQQSGSDATLCTGEVFGYGEGGAKYKTKQVEKGRINCKNCLQIIKKIKAIKL